MHVNAGILITSIKPKLLSNGFEFADDIWGLTERGWSIEFHFDHDSSIISQIWIETVDYSFAGQTLGNSCICRSFQFSLPGRGRGTQLRGFNPGKDPIKGTP